MCDYDSGMNYRLLRQKEAGGERHERRGVRWRRRMRPRAPRRTLVVLPTLFTLANALCGFLSIFIASRIGVASDLPFGWSALTCAALLIFAGMIFDALDGRIARLTGHTSTMGEQLDSMSDMVSFGVAPAFMAIQLVGVKVPFFSASQDQFLDRAALLIAGIYVSCTALRLARFNAELSRPSESDHASFKGLPSPGAAGTVASLVLLHEHLITGSSRSLAPITASLMMMAMLLTAFAMVSTIRYVHVMNRFFRNWAKQQTIALMVAAMLLMLIWPQLSVAVVLLGYALSGPTGWLWRLVRGQSTTAAAAANAGSRTAQGEITGATPGTESAPPVLPSENTRRAV